MTISASEIRSAARAGSPIRVRSTADGDCGNALRVSSTGWSKGYVEVAFDNGQKVWVRPSFLRAA